MGREARWMAWLRRWAREETYGKSVGVGVSRYSLDHFKFGAAKLGVAGKELRRQNGADGMWMNDGAGCIRRVNIIQMSKWRTPKEDSCRNRAANNTNRIGGDKWLETEACIDWFSSLWGLLLTKDFEREGVQKWNDRRKEKGRCGQEGWKNVLEYLIYSCQLWQKPATACATPSSELRGTTKISCGCIRSFWTLEGAIHAPPVLKTVIPPPVPDTHP